MNKIFIILGGNKIRIFSYKQLTESLTQTGGSQDLKKWTICLLRFVETKVSDSIWEWN